ncbi:MAG: hypothetical protein RMY30_036735 [Nostoc sp. CmiSLP01]|nr:hypothetical protein [Nostoc sp. CmiSLP01]MDZ8286328.1 hypothetical protein [Nostoc sp. ChiSLP01]
MLLRLGQLALNGSYSSGWVKSVATSDQKSVDVASFTQQMGEEKSHSRNLGQLEAIQQATFEGGFIH